jgi:chitinase
MERIKTGKFLVEWIGYTLMFFFFLFISCPAIFAQSVITKQSSLSADTTLWVSAYLASWNHFAPPGGNWGVLPTNDIEWNAFTQLIYFALPVMHDGQIKEIKPYENVNPDRVKAVTRAAHLHNKPVLISIGGWGNYDNFSKAINANNRTRFVANLTQLIRQWNFDGIDLDMEPIKDKDITNYVEFVKDLFQELQKINLPNGKQPMLTTVTRWQPNMFASIYQYFNQVNLMTYDLSGAWHGWVSWYNSAIYSAGHNFPGSDRALPSVNQIVDEFLNAGIPAKKLGIGIDFYGYIWSGLSKPNKGWGLFAPRVKANVPYTTIMKDYFQKDRYRWDDKSKAAYLSINDDQKKLFITYDGVQTIKAKVHYARDKKLGGIFLWELSASYFPNNSSAEKDSLLRAVIYNVNNVISQ